MKILSLVAVFVLVVGCGGGAESFDTPENAVKSFISAAADKDVEALSKCFAKTCEGEFKDLRDKSASDEMLGELAEMFKGATVGEAKTEGSSSKVEVKLSEGSETISVKKEGDAWKIQGF